MILYIRTTTTTKIGCGNATLPCKTEMSTLLQISRIGLSLSSTPEHLKHQTQERIHCFREDDASSFANGVILQAV